MKITQLIKVEEPFQLEFATPGCSEEANSDITIGKNFMERKHNTFLLLHCKSLRVPKSLLYHRRFYLISYGYPVPRLQYFLFLFIFALGDYM